MFEYARILTGQDRTGQDRTGQDRTGQDRTGQDRTGQERKSMIKIAIVEDEEYSAIKCRSIISSAKIPDIQIDIFNDGKHFSKVVFENKEPFDIIILDIDMPDITGFDIARRLREENPDVIIMFYTAHEQYVFKSFEFQPFRYIRKIVAEVELPFALECAMLKLKQLDSEVIVVKNNRTEIVVEIEKIRFAEKYKNNIEIFLADGESILTPMTLFELYESLNNKNFIYAHKGAIVNLKYIKKLTEKTIILKDDLEINISRRLYLSVKKAFADYLGDII